MLKNQQNINDTESSEDFSRLLFSSDAIRIGRFHAPYAHPHFSESGKIQLPTLVFPRSSVLIESENKAPFLSDVTRVNLYDGKHQYRRACVANNDDICDWFEFDLSLFNDLSQWQDSEELLLKFTQNSVNSDYSILVKERLLFKSLNDDNAGPLAIEEAALDLLRHIVLGNKPKPETLDKKTTAKHKAISQALCVLLQQKLGENLLLGELAGLLNTSSYHLCRIFRYQTGMSIHQYRTQLRLKQALSLLVELKDISQVALELGFSSHSHFSTAFYKAYSLSPRDYLQSYKHAHTTNNNRP